MPKRAAPSIDVGENLGGRFAKRALLAASAGVFSKHGIEATRIEDLLAASGVSRRTFYKYFRSKDEVLLSLYEEATSELLSVVRSAQGSSPSKSGRATSAKGAKVEALRRGIDVYLSFHLENARLLRGLVERAMQSNSPLAPRRRWLQDELVHLAHDAARSLGRRRVDPLLFYALFGALEGLSLHLFGATFDARDLARAKRVLHGLLDHALGVE